MDAKQRREAIEQEILQSEKVISASKLASKFHVSRQIIVGDIALLRAAQKPIIATPRGYLYQKEENKNRYVLACLHDEKGTLDELYTIVDCGGEVENVIVSHAVYGELVGALHIHNRVEAMQFVEQCEKQQVKNLSTISNGVHLHTIICKDDAQYQMIVEELNKKGYLYQK
ncbi:MAG: transcription repressor NadR [Erysipelotrichia bacterium]|nr:transcription repressor NadR [Erysipelotrichia bacterium]NCC54537.1 transcription repressor NadR [Erysipelotrichia bacterium]